MALGRHCGPSRCTVVPPGVEIMWYRAQRAPAFLMVCVVCALVVASATLCLCALGRSTQALAVSGAAPKPGLVYVEGERLMLDGSPFVMKGYCYLPRDYAWTALCDWDWDEVDRELALAREYGANTIRTGYDYTYTTGDLYFEHPFTKYKFTPENLDAIDKLLTVADKHGLKVVLYIGGGPPGIGWDPANYWITEKRLQAMIPRFAGDPRLAAWDLCTDLDGAMLQPPAPTGGGAYGVDPAATRDNMVTLLSNMASTIKSLDPDHLITVGFCWLSSSLLTQDFTDFLMPQFLGGDAPNILVSEGPAQMEPYNEAFWEYANDPEKAVDMLASKLLSLKEGLRRPMPIVLAEYGFSTRGPNEFYSEAMQKTVYEAVLETAFLRLEIAGALNWALTDFNWPPKAKTISWPEGLTDIEASFGILDVNYQPKPAAEVARAYYADSPEIELSTGHRRLDFFFGKSFIPAEDNPGSDDRRELCAAFDWIEFQDSAGKTLLRLDVGAAEARPYLKRGFYPDEGPWGDEAENFAWAGNAQKQATVDVSFPEGTAAIVFRATANFKQRVEVRVDGETAGTDYINTGWHRCQVAVPASGPPRVGGSCQVQGVMNLPLSKGVVTVQSSYDGNKWTDVARMTPERGRFTAKVNLAHAGRALVRATWSGAGYYGPADSKPLEIQVERAPTELKLAVTSPAGGGGFPVGGQVILAGIVTPGRVDLPVSLAVTQPDGSTLTHAAKTTAEGRFEFALNLDSPGLWTAQATFAGDNDYLGSQATCSFLVAAAETGQEENPLVALVPIWAAVGGGVAAAGMATAAVLLLRRRKHQQQQP
ncbi:MAG: hypothetical protein N3B14_03365 [Thermoleophilia bacterium]|nr:hypothetical protein [Thermoleophilia bacterium]